jgi:putative membrane protein
MKSRLLALPSLALLGLFHPLLALAQQGAPPPDSQYYNMPYWHGPGHMWGGGFWWGGPLMMLGLFILVGFIAFMIGRRSRYGCHHCHHHPGPWHMRGGAPGPESYGDPTYSALQILNERFARGEIQKPEYDEKKAAILSTGPR